MLDKKIPVIIPCCGIDSVYGLMTQEIALKVKEEMNKQTELFGLACLVNGETEAVQTIANTPYIVINKCCGTARWGKSYLSESRYSV